MFRNYLRYRFLSILVLFIFIFIFQGNHHASAQVTSLPSESLAIISGAEALFGQFSFNPYTVFFVIIGIVMAGFLLIYFGGMLLAAILIIPNTRVNGRLYCLKNKVIFKDYDGRIIKSQMIRSEQDAVAPDSPERLGYTFEGWLGDYAHVTSDTEIVASYQARTDTIYTVEHYKQEPNSTDYVLADSDKLTGITDTETVAVPKEYPGHSENSLHTARVASGNIQPDGSLVLRLYYDRNVIEIDLNKKKKGRIIIAFGEPRENADFHFENKDADYELIIEAIHDKSKPLFKQGWAALFKKNLPVLVVLSCTPPGVVEYAGAIFTEIVLTDGCLFSSGGVNFKYHNNRNKWFKDSSTQEDGVGDGVYEKVMGS